MPNPGKSKFSKRGKKKGHYETIEQYKKSPYITLKSKAWRDLNGNSIKIYHEICTRFNGSNNGKISFGYNEGVAIFGMGKNTVSKALKQLIEFGFLKRSRRGTFYGRKASTFIITDERHNNQPPTRDWRNYKPKPKRKKLNIGFKTILKEAQEEIETAENSLNGNLGVSK